MYNRLIEYAEKNGLYTKSGFGERRVSYLIDIDSDGKLNNVYDKRIEHNRGKKVVLEPSIFIAPKEIDDNVLIKLMGSGDRKAGFSHFLIETAETVLLLDDSDKIARKNGIFMMFLLDFLEYASMNGVNTDHMHPIVLFLSSDEEMEKARVEIRKINSFKPFEQVSFSINLSPSLESETWHSWWRLFWKTDVGDRRVSDKKMVCVFTGNEVYPVLTHTKIRGLAPYGGNPSGDALISFDKDAFGSYGLTQGENAASSSECIEKYSLALNDLISKSKSFGGGVKYVYWYSEKLQIDPISVLDNPGQLYDFDIEDSDDNNVRERNAIDYLNDVMDSLIDGNGPTDSSYEQYYFMALSGNGGRVMVRGYEEGSIPSLVNSINSWFNDQELVIYSPSTKKLSYSKPARFFSVLSSTCRDSEASKLPASIKNSLWMTALSGGPVNPVLVHNSIKRMQIDKLNGEHNASRETLRVGLIKMYLIRNHGVEMEKDMNDNKSVSYNMGRLLAVLDSIQYRSIGEANKSVVGRFYTSASKNPSMVLGSMMNLAQHHLSKLESGSRTFFSKKIQEILSNINASDIMGTFGLKDQSLFSIGFYHQKTDLYNKQTNEQAE